MRALQLHVEVYNLVECEGKFSFVMDRENFGRKRSRYIISSLPWWLIKNRVLCFTCSTAIQALSVSRILLVLIPAFNNKTTSHSYALYHSFRSRALTLFIFWLLSDCEILKGYFFHFFYFFVFWFLSWKLYLDNHFICIVSIWLKYGDTHLMNGNNIIIWYNEITYTVL